MAENRLQQLADELSAEVDEFLKIESVVLDAQSRVSAQDPGIYDLYALGAILHDVYQGAESICFRVVKEIDRRVPQGANWHRDLLDQMARAVPNTRPPVIRRETAAMMENYRRFRHRFRNIYGFELDWVQMKPLLENAIPMIETFAADVRVFTDFLRLMNGDST